MCEPPALFNSGDREPKDAPANAPGPPALKVVLFGATGNVGRRMASEALNRGYEVVGVVRDPAQSQSPDLRLTLVQGDATDAESVSRVARGADVVVQRNRHPVGSSTTLVGDPLGSFGELLEGPLGAIRGSYYAEVAPKRVTKQTSKPKTIKPLTRER
jgi:hypothetical protein